MLHLKVYKLTESKKSVFVKVIKKAGPLQSNVGVGYMYLEENMEEEEKEKLVGTSFTYDGEVEFRTIADPITGEVRTTKEGVELQEVILK